jgi:Fic family protein
MSFPDKFSLSREQEKFLLSKNLPGLIHSTTRFENLTTTLLQTEEILRNELVSGVRPSDIEVTLNLKRAFDYIVSLEYEETWEFYFYDIESINRIIQGSDGYKPGEIRTENVVVPTSSEVYTPRIPDVAVIKSFFDDLKRNSELTTTEKAIKLMLRISMDQWFTDGNKRTALVMANAIMYWGNAGIIVIPEDKMHWYLSKLKKFYMTCNRSVEDWLYQEAIFGV